MTQWYEINECREVCTKWMQITIHIRSLRIITFNWGQSKSMKHKSNSIRWPIFDKIHLAVVCRNCAYLYSYKVILNNAVCKMKGGSNHKEGHTFKEVASLHTQWCCFIQHLQVFKLQWAYRRHFCTHLLFVFCTHLFVFYAHACGICAHFSKHACSLLCLVLVEFSKWSLNFVLYCQYRPCKGV